MTFTTVLMIALVVLLWAVVLLAGGYTLWALWDFARSLPRRRRVTRWLFIGSFSLLILGTLAFSVWVVNVQRQLHNELTRIRQAGEPVTLAELVPTTTDPSMEDAGIHYRRALELLRAASLQPDVERQEEHALRVELRDAFRNWLEGRSNTSPTDEERVRARELLEVYRPVLEAADRAASIEECHFDWQLNSGINEAMARLGKARGLVNWQNLRTVVALGEGDTEQALRSVESQARMLRIFDQSTPITGYFVRNANEILLVHDIVTVTASGAADAPTLKRFAAVLAALAQPERLTETLIAERAFGLALMGVAQPEAAQALPGSWGSAMPGFARDAVAVSYLDVLRRHIDASKLPLLEARSAIVGIRGKGIYAVLTDPLGPSVESAMAIIGRSHAQASAGRLVIACELYRRERGALPENLDDLVPVYAEAVALDPFTGQPMKYLRDGDTVAIYSVGEDQTDDGGKVKSEDDNQPRDWGFRVRLGVKRSAE